MNLIYNSGNEGLDCLLLYSYGQYDYDAEEVIEYLILMDSLDILTAIDMIESRGTV